MCYKVPELFEPVGDNSSEAWFQFREKFFGQEQFCENNDWSGNSSASLDEKVLCYHKKHTSLHPDIFGLLVEWIWTDNEFHGQPGFECLKKATETHKEGYCDYIYDTFHCIHPIPAGETLYYQCSYADTAICNEPPTLTLPAANSSFCRGTAADNSPIQYYASRKCYENATWEPKAYDALCDLMETDPTIFRNSTSELDRHQTLDKIYYHCSIWPPLLSVICLIVACFLFNVKTLRCTRIFIHQNLIIAWIFKYSLSIIVFLIGRGITAGIEETAAGDASGSSQIYVQEDSQQYLPVYTTGNGSYSYDYAADYYASSGNGYGPPISIEKSRSPWNDPQVEASLNIIHQYFYLVGSVWFFIEAIFLQYQIAMNVFNPSSTLKMKVLVAVAWGVPIVMLVPWIVLTHRRLAISHFENREQFFNTTLAVVNYNEFIQSAKSWRNVNDFDEIFVISALQLAMLIISFFILLNIVRIIMTKVRVTAGNDFEVFKKSVKATCSLLPLFGLSVIIGLYHKPQSSESLFPTFLILLQNLQGVFIATIYCFMNKDVQRMVKSRFTRVVQRHSSAFYSQGTQHSQLSVSEQLSQRWSKVVARISSNGSGRPTSSLLEASETGMTPANQTSSGLSSSLHQRPAGSTLTSI